MIEKFFTTEQVANILQVHPFTILKFIKQGKLKGVKLGRVYRIMESDVEAFLESRMTSAPQKKEKQAEPSPQSQVSKQEESFQVQRPESQAEKHIRSEKKGNSEDDHYYII